MRLLMYCHIYIKTLEDPKENIESTQTAGHDAHQNQGVSEFTRTL